MPSYPVDGMDPEKIAKVAYFAIERARKGEGATFLDMKTYRYRGHSMSDSELYRNKEEVNSYKKKDPILKLKNTIIQNKWETIENLNTIENKVKKKVESCVEFAEQSNFPSLEEMYNVVYHEKNYPFLDKV